MLKNPESFKEWEDDFLRSEPPDYHRNLVIFEAMREEAVMLGVFLPKDPLEGIETIIQTAKVLNVPLADQDDC